MSKLANCDKRLMVWIELPFVATPPAREDLQIPKHLDGFDAGQPSIEECGGRQMLALDM
jgi:hypothetical protein